MDRRLDVTIDAAPAVACAAASRDAFARAPHLRAPHLTLLAPTDETLVRGAFETDDRGAVARASGGAAMCLAPGTLHLMFAAPSLAALGDATPSNLLNRLVRPLLRALTRAGATATYFGRDWVSAAKLPVAFVGFAHDAATGAVLFESIVGVSAAFATDARRASYRGHAPSTVADVAGRSIAPTRVAELAAEAYADAWNLQPSRVPFVVPDRASEPAPPPRWKATADDAMGEVGAAFVDGMLRIGGAIMVSHDALASLEAEGARATSREALAEVVAAHLARPQVAVFGVRLDAIARVAWAALGARQ